VEGLELAFTLLGGLSVAVGAGLAVWRLSMLFGWKRQRGRVVAYSRQPARRRGDAVRLTVRIEVDDGEAIDATDEGVWSRYAVDDVVTVLVRPGSDPVSAVVPEALRFWMLPAVFLGLGGAFLYVALVVAPALPSPSG
jgi:hypothetical protein